MTNEIVPAQRLSDFLYSVPYEVIGQWFYKKSLYLDGYAFSECRFDGCVLCVSKGIFKLTKCFMQNCTIIYTDEARNVVRLFTGAHIPSTVFVNSMLRPVYNADGTITIDPLNT